MRNGEILYVGYAPSEYRKKPWPIEALLEGWCLLIEEAHKGFAFVAYPAVSPTRRADQGDARRQKITRAAGGQARYSPVKAMKSASRQKIVEADDDRESLFLTAVSLEGATGGPIAPRRGAAPTLAATT